MPFGDMKLNMEVDEEGCNKCHGASSPVHSSNGDIARVTIPLECIYQRIAIWKGTKKGERPMNGNLGCCIRDYINEPLTGSRLLDLQKDLEIELAQVVPEMPVTRVKVWSDERNKVSIESYIGDFEVNFTASAAELDQLHESLYSAMKDLRVGIFS